MDIPKHHRWDVAPKEALVLQRELASGLPASGPRFSIERIAGVDVSYDRGTDRLWGGVVVLDYRTLELVETVVVEAPAAFPYVPGLLSFREVPVLLQALAQVERAPDVIICDGQGLAHPRRFGLACHLGSVLRIPTLGCAKSRLIGTHEEPGREKAQWTPLRDDGDIIGSVLRTRTGVSPVYVSSGYRIGLPHARDIVLHCSPRCRLPETTRRAHEVVNKKRKEFLSADDTDERKTLKRQK